MCEGFKLKYQLCEEIGRGRFEVVYRFFSSITGESYACKSTQKNLLLDAADRECLEKDSKIIHLLSGDPSILRLIDTYEGENYLHVVTEHCSGGDLYERLVGRGQLSEPKAAEVFRKLMTAIVHYHRIGIAHRDLKPDNMLFDSQGNLKLAVSQGC